MSDYESALYKLNRARRCDEMAKDKRSIGADFQAEALEFEAARLVEQARIELDSA